MLVFNNYFYKNRKSKLYFGDRVAVLNDFIYQTTGGSIVLAWGHRCGYFIKMVSDQGWPNCLSVGCNPLELFLKACECAKCHGENVGAIHLTHAHIIVHSEKGTSSNYTNPGFDRSLLC
jgi:hypothetical protein